MTAGWLLILGLLHGLQPDHALSASAIAARTGSSATRSALRLALGHAAALALGALTIGLIPAPEFARVESFAGQAGGATLVLFGLLLAFQAIRGQYLLHAHAHEHGQRHHEHLHTHPVDRQAVHEHGHAASSIGVGLALGLGGARSLAVLIPSMKGLSSAVMSISAYALGVAAGCVLASAGVDLVRRLLAARARWLDLAMGLASCVAGARVIAGI